MRFLITGGYGFLGAWIARELLAQGAAVVAYDLREDPRRLRAIMPPDEAAKVTFAQGDVTDLPALTDALKTHAITHVIHLAGLQVPTCRANPILGATVNVVGTLAVFEAVKATGEQVKRVVYASSAAVFGPPEAYPGGSQTDDAKLLPSTHYGVFKICNEGNARVYYQDHAISSVGLRPWTVYGPGRDMGMTSEPTKAIKACLLGRPYAINFGGTTDFQYVRDVASAFILSATRPFTGAGAYNLRGAVVTMKEFHAALCQVLPDAAKLVTIGTTQIAIHPDLSDTVELFRRQHAAGTLDTSDIDAAAPPAAVTTDEV
jgi:nucleoside-diphosphate-sugar epimerase